MEKGTKQNPEAYIVPKGAIEALKGEVKRVKARENLGYLSGEYADYRIDSDEIESDGSVSFYATILYGRREDHTGWENWYEVLVCKVKKEYVVDPL